MKKIEIIEIENSFLNFFTPAVLVAISYFFLNLIGWPSLLLGRVFTTGNVPLQVSNFINFTISVIYLSTTCFLLYYLLIYHPRLKVHDADFKEVSKYSLYVTLVFFFMIMSLKLILLSFYQLKFGPPRISPAYFFPLETLQVNLIFLLLNLFHDSVLYTLFNEIVFRRTLIPLLEDRGLSPFHAVILAALGNTFIDLPAYVLFPNHPTDIYNFILGFFVGLCAGMIYILTRNIFFPFLFSFTFSSYQFLEGITPKPQLHLFNSINILFFLITIGISFFYIFRIVIKNQPSRLLKIIRRKSSPKIVKGLVGFFVFSLGLLGIQTIVVKIGRTLFITTPGEPFPEYFIYISIFYAIAFTIPFFLTISTEWAKDPIN